MTPPSKKKQRSDFMQYTSMAMKMAIVILLFVMGGRWGDNCVTSLAFPLFTLVGAMVGVGLAIYIVIKDTAPKK